MTDLIPPHLTASAAVFDDDGRILLVFHRLYNLWVVPGGHVDVGELPHVAAVREVLEETGLHIRVVSAVALPDVPGCTVAPAPWIVAEIPHPGKPEKGEPAHTHLDLLYVARYDGVEPFTPELDEVDAACWATPAEVATLPVRADVPVLALLASVVPGHLVDPATLAS